MRRRDFCRLIGATAATAVAASVPVVAETSDRAELPVAVAAEHTVSPSEGFDTLTEDYAAFCGKPADRTRIT